MVLEGDLPLGAEHTIPHTADVLLHYTSGTYVIV